MAVLALVQLLVDESLKRSAMLAGKLVGTVRTLEHA